MSPHTHLTRATLPLRLARVGLVTVALVAVVLVATPASSGRADTGDAGGPTIAAGSISAGGDFTCVVLDDGSVRCWGDNLGGSLGVGDTATRGDGPGEMGDALPVVDLGAGRTAVSVSAGDGHACAVLDNGAVKCWGLNIGQLGLGDTDQRGDQPGEMGDALPVVDLGTGRTALSVSAGNAHTCALLDNGAVKCWGANSRGELGQGDTAARGDAPGEMGDALPAIDLGSGRTATAISTGENFSCAILDDASVKCWGSAQNGRIGLGIVNTTESRGDAPGEMGDALPAVALGTGAKAVAISSNVSHTCVVLDTGRVKCWGNGSSGRLGYGNTTTLGDAAAEMGNGLPFVDLGQGQRAASVSAGNGHTCAVLTNDLLKCWGGGDNGKLALGTADARGDAAGEMGDALPHAQLGTGRYAAAVATGGSHTCVVLDNGGVKCVGSGFKGATGLGDTGNRGNSPTHLGDSLPYLELPGTVAAPGVAVTLVADAASVVVGRDVTYTVTLRNTGGQTLTGVEVQSGDVASCERSIEELEPGESTSYECALSTDALDVPFVTNHVLVMTERGLTRISRTVRTTVEPVRRRPDALVRVSSGAFVGSNVYSTSAGSQRRSTTVVRRGTARFTIRVQNDGNVDDSYRVSGRPGSSAYSVTYRRGQTNVTAAVIAGTYSTGTLGPGATHDITVVVQALRPARTGNSITRALTVSGGGTRDVVSFTVTRR